MVCYKAYNWKWEELGWVCAILGQSKVAEVSTSEGSLIKREFTVYETHLVLGDLSLSWSTMSWYFSAPDWNSTTCNCTEQTPCMASHLAIITESQSPPLSHPPTHTTHLSSWLQSHTPIHTTPIHTTHLSSGLQQCASPPSCGLVVMVRQEGLERERERERERDSSLACEDIACSKPICDANTKEFCDSKHGKAIVHSTNLWISFTHCNVTQKSPTRWIHYFTVTPWISYYKYL